MAGFVFYDSIYAIRGRDDFMGDVLEQYEWEAMGKPTAAMRMEFEVRGSRGEAAWSSLWDWLLTDANAQQRSDEELTKPSLDYTDPT